VSSCASSKLRGGTAPHKSECIQTSPLGEGTPKSHLDTQWSGGRRLLGTRESSHSRSDKARVCTSTRRDEMQYLSLEESWSILHENKQRAYARSPSNDRKGTCGRSDKTRQDCEIDRPSLASKSTTTAFMLALNRGIIAGGQVGLF
jgi:hypothetical protein